MAVEDLQIWADHLETIRLPEIEADIADIQPRLSQAEADIVSKVQTINDTLTLHSARIDEAQVDADAAMDRANYALTRVYDQFIEANSNWMMALDALRDEFTYDLNSSTAAITDAYTNAILAQLSAATLQLQTQFAVKVAEVESIKSTIDGIKANIDLDIDTLNNTILPGMNAEIDQLQLDTGTIAGDLTTLQSDLQTFYYSATDTELAIAGAITTAKSEIEDPNGTSLGATLAQSYRTSADQDAATAAQLLTLQSDIEDTNGTSLGATLSTDYLTTVNTNAAISAAISTLKSNIENPDGSSLGATLNQNYLTSAETNSAIASADATLKSQIESPTGTIRSFLTTNYLTSAETDTTIAGYISTLKSQIEDPNGSSLGATLNQNYYTSASTDSAIAAEISTVQASINGVSADVTAVSNALADVEGNLAASYTLRVGAGGASAGFEIVAADNPSGPASTIRMDADNILIGGTVTADHIDSRGLSIRDANNNIILAAGTPLAVTNVSGLGNLATQDTVGWTSVTGRPGSLADLDAAAATQLDNKSVTYYQTFSPSTSIADTGDIWFDTNDSYKMYSFNGTSWQLVQDSAAASAAAAQAATDASEAQATADGKIVTFYQTTQPSGSDGDLWYNPETKILRRYNGSTWKIFQANTDVVSISGPIDPVTQRLDDDIVSVNSDGIVTLYHPTDTSIGMAFKAERVNVTAGETITLEFQYRSSSNSSSGLYVYILEYDAELEGQKKYLSNYSVSDIEDPRQYRTRSFTRLSNVAVTTEWQTFEYTYVPTANAKWAGVQILNWTGLSTRKLEISGLRFKRDYTALGTTANWGTVTGRPTTLAQLDNDAATQLDAKAVTYYQSSPPTGLSALNNGDIWFDTDANYKMHTYQHTGGGWIEVQNSAAASAAAAAAQADANTAQATADGKITTWYGTLSSGDLAQVQTGDLWYNNNILYRRNSTNTGWNVVSNAYTNTSQLSDDLGLGNTAVWSGVSGSGRPDDNATVGATFGVNVSGQITQSTASTFIADAAIGNAQIANAAITNAKIGNLEVDSAKIANLTVGTGKITNNAVTNVGSDSGAPADIEAIAFCEIGSQILCWVDVSWDASSENDATVSASLILNGTLKRTASRFVNTGGTGHFSLFWTGVSGGSSNHTLTVGLGINRLNGTVSGTANAGILSRKK